jgi:hypothetical protein
MRYEREDGFLSDEECEARRRWARRLADGDAAPGDIDLDQETIDEVMHYLLQRWDSDPGGSRRPVAGHFVHWVLRVWADEIRAAHSEGDTPRLELALTGIVRDAGQMAATAAFHAHVHHHQHAGKGKAKREGQKFTDADIVEEYRAQLEQGRAPGRALKATAEECGISDRTVRRAFERLGVSTKQVASDIHATAPTSRKQGGQDEEQRAEAGLNVPTPSCIVDPSYPVVGVREGSWVVVPELAKEDHHLYLWETL